MQIPVIVAQFLKPINKEPLTFARVRFQCFSADSDAPYRAIAAQPIVQRRPGIFDYKKGFYHRVRRHKQRNQFKSHEFKRQRQISP